MIVSFFFFAQNDPDLAMGAPSSWLVGPFDMPSSSFEYFSIFWHHEMLQVIQYFPCFSPGIIYYLREPGFFSCRIWVPGIDHGFFFLTEDQWTSTICGLQNTCASFPIICRILCVYVFVFIFLGGFHQCFQRVLDLKVVKNYWLRVSEFFQCICVYCAFMWNLIFLQVCGYVKYVDLGKKDENFYRRRRHR